MSQTELPSDSKLATEEKPTFANLLCCEDDEVGWTD